MRRRLRLVGSRQGQVAPKMGGRRESADAAARIRRQWRPAPRARQRQAELLIPAAPTEIPHSRRGRPRGGRAGMQSAKFERGSQGFRHRAPLGGKGLHRLGNAAQEGGDLRPHDGNLVRLAGDGRSPWAGAAFAALPRPSSRTTASVQANIASLQRIGPDWIGPSVGVGGTCPAPASGYRSGCRSITCQPRACSRARAIGLAWPLIRTAPRRGLGRSEAGMPAPSVGVQAR